MSVWTLARRDGAHESVDPARDPQGGREAGRAVDGRRPARRPTRSRSRRIRAACDTVLSQHPKEALQYAASEGFPPLREWVAARLRPGRLPRRGRPGADHDRIAAGARSGRQGVHRRRARRWRSKRRPTSARCRPSFRTSRVRQPGVRRRGPDARGGGRRCRAARPARASCTCCRISRTPPAGRLATTGVTALVAAARAAGVPIVEDNPYGDLWFDQAPPAVDDLALARGLHVPRLVLEGAHAGLPARVPGRAPRRVPASWSRPSRPPTSTRRGSTSAWSTRSCATASSTATCRRSASATASSATPWRRRCARTCPTAPRGRSRAAACSSGCGCPRASTRCRCSTRRSTAGVAFVPGAPFYAADPDVRTLRLSFVTLSPAEIADAVAVLGRVLAEAVRTRRRAAAGREHALWRRIATARGAGAAAPCRRRCITSSTARGVRLIFG